MGRTRIKLDFVIEHEGDQLFPVMSPLDLIEYGIAGAIKEETKRRSKGWQAPKLLAILPGAKLDMRIPRRRSGGTTVLSKIGNKSR